MPDNIKVTLKARCTSCRQTYTPSDKEIEEAKDFGCLMSPCCMSPAIVEEAAVRRQKRKPLTR